MFDRFLEEASNRKAPALDKYNAAVLHAKKTCASALQYLDEDKEIRPLKKQVSQLTLISVDAKIDAASIQEHYAQVVRNNLAVSKKIEYQLPALKAKMDKMEKEAKSGVKLFNDYFTNDALKVEISPAEAAGKIKKTLMGELEKKLDNGMKERIEKQITKLDAFLQAYQAYHKIARYISALRDNSLIKRFCDEVVEAQKYVSVSELRVMGTAGSHHTLALLDRIRFDEELENKLQKIERRLNLIKTANCLPDNKFNFETNKSLAEDACLVAQTFLKKHIEDCLDKIFVTQKAEEKDLNFDEKFCQKRREIVFAKLVKAEEYLDNAALLINIPLDPGARASGKPLAKPKAPESKQSPADPNKHNADHVMMLSRLHQQMPVTKVAVALANAAEPPLLLNPRSTQQDAQNLRKLAEGGPVSLKKMLSEAPDAPLPPRVLTVSLRPRLVIPSKDLDQRAQITINI